MFNRSKNALTNGRGPQLNSYAVWASFFRISTQKKFDCGLTAAYTMHRARAEWPFNLGAGHEGFCQSSMDRLHIARGLAPDNDP
jgi:hypothetical protein